MQGSLTCWQDDGHLQLQIPQTSLVWFYIQAPEEALRGLHFIAIRHWSATGHNSFTRRLWNPTRKPWSTL